MTIVKIYKGGRRRQNLFLMRKYEASLDTTYRSRRGDGCCYLNTRIPHTHCELPFSVAPPVCIREQPPIVR
eukprot:scaffold4905_cov98-Cylindrotheca_fusiformis.AAC.6